MADWDAMRAEYIAGGVTYKELASKYGLSERTVRTYASRKGWKTERDKVETKAGQNVLARACENKTRELEALMGAASKWTQTIQEIVEAVSANPTALIVENMRGMGELSRSIATMTDVMLRLNRISTPAEEERMETSRARLKLEREKWNAEVEEKKALQTGENLPTWVVEVPEGVELDG